MENITKLSRQWVEPVNNNMENRPIRSRKMIERPIIFEGYSPELHWNSTEETLWSFIRNSRKYNDTAHGRETMTYKRMKAHDTEELGFEIIEQA